MISSLPTVTVVILLPTITFPVGRQNLTVTLQGSLYIIALQHRRPRGKTAVLDVFLCAVQHQ